MQHNQAWSKPCIVCHKNPRNVVIIPCGHNSVCHECADVITKNPIHGKCPSCDQTVERAQKIVI